ncbi:MAG: alpha-L-fucosidase [Spirochaetota bacterium]
MNVPSPTRAQTAWLTLRYGMFVSFGMNTFAGCSWGDGRVPAANFDPTHLDTDQWMEVAAEAGMKYAVLTAKHHDGFCLWPTRHTEYCVRNSPGRPDVVGRFAESCRKAGIRAGLYYSLWDRNFPNYEDDAAYCDLMFAQIEELLTQYGDVIELWFDGAWDKDHPTRTWQFDETWERERTPGYSRGERWRWRELYEMIHRLQPDCLVVNNTSSDRPGAIKYLPVDIRTSEHFNFIYRGRRVDTRMDPVFIDEQGGKNWIAMEYCTSLNPEWFFIEGRYYPHPSALAIADWLRTARNAGGNLLLNVGPDKQGSIPEYHRPFLRDAAHLSM